MLPTSQACDSGTTWYCQMSPGVKHPHPTGSWEQLAWGTGGNLSSGRECLSYVAHFQTALAEGALRASGRRLREKVRHGSYTKWSCMLSQGVWNFILKALTRNWRILSWEGIWVNLCLRKDTLAYCRGWVEGRSGRRRRGSRREAMSGWKGPGRWKSCSGQLPRSCSRLASRFSAGTIRRQC